MQAVSTQGCPRSRLVIDLDLNEHDLVYRHQEGHVAVVGASGQCSSTVVESKDDTKQPFG